MNKILKSIRNDITDYDIRVWGESVIIHNHENIFCVLEMYDNELTCFGLQTNLGEDREEKVLKLCLELGKTLKELNKYLKGDSDDYNN